MRAHLQIIGMDLLLARVYCSHIREYEFVRCTLYVVVALVSLTRRLQSGRHILRIGIVLESV
jgi:hypothetical protein